MIQVISFSPEIKAVLYHIQTFFLSGFAFNQNIETIEGTYLVKLPGSPGGFGDMVQVLADKLYIAALNAIELDRVLIGAVFVQLYLTIEVIQVTSDAFYQVAVLIKGFGYLVQFVAAG